MYSPWRSKYIATFKEPEKEKPKGGSIFADIAPEDDEARLVVYRGKTCFIIMNLYPYNAGHLMVLPYRVTPDLNSLSSEEKLDMMNLTELAVDALAETIKPHGFNIGANLGAVSGGSVDTHIHLHIVPRWNGDTNFMPVLGDVKVISNDMTEMYHQLRAACKKLAVVKKLA
jgi:ATP adenylyltransferase